METKNISEEFPSVSFEEFPVTEYEEWKQEAINALKGGSFEKALFTKTYEGITLEPIYTSGHPEHEADEPEYPGRIDYKRGIKASGYINRPWTVAQASEGSSPEQVNEILKRELQKGSQAVNISLSEETLHGEKPFSDENECYSPKRLALSTLQDMCAVLKDIPADENEIHVYAGSSASPVLALFAAEAEANGRKDKLKSYRGCIGADPIGLLAEEGKLPCFMDELYDEMALAIYWCRKNMPDMKTIMVRGDSYHNGGANAVQEVAYCVASAIAYIDAMQIRGLDIDTICRNIRFSFSLGGNFFMEISKLRAARRIWSQVTAAYGAGEEAQKMDIFARTSYFTETVYDPAVNILRTTSQAFSGVVGGVSSLQVAPYDDAAGISDEQSRRIARNIQLMFQNEFDMLRPVDPAGGSWYIESLTKQLTDEIWKTISKISAEGGILKLLKNGDVQREINSVLNERQKNLAMRKDRVVGTNMYSNMSESSSKACASLNEIKSERTKNFEDYLRDIDDIHCDKLLSELPGYISGEPENFVDALIRAFMAGAALNQVRTALNDGFEGDMEIEPIVSHRWTEQYEQLRKRSEDYEKKTGQSVRIFLANMGPIPQHKARADFTTGFMEVAHFEVMKNNGFATIEEAVQAAVESKADVTVICSTDDTYPELVPPLAGLLKAKCPDMLLLLAGMPAAEHKDAYVEAGVDDFIHVRSNCYEMLCNIQKKKGVY